MRPRSTPRQPVAARFEAALRAAFAQIAADADGHPTPTAAVEALHDRLDAYWQALGVETADRLYRENRAAYEAETDRDAVSGVRVQPERPHDADPTGRR